MTKKKTGGSDKNVPNAARPKVPPPNVRKNWGNMVRENEEKLKELEYENKYGVKPPKPWYEE